MLKFDNNLRQTIYILIILPLLSFGQTDINLVIGTYKSDDEKFHYKLELNDDSTFLYHMSFPRGSTSSTGKWSLKKDTIILYNYAKPFVIKTVEERHIDSLHRSSIVNIGCNFDTNGIHIRENCCTVYLNGKPTIFKPMTGWSGTPYFNFWINDNCEKILITDKSGQIKLSKSKIKKISFDYDNYTIKDLRCNYFIVTLDNAPLHISPPTLTWTKWILTGDSLSPIDCKRILNYIVLKR